MSHHAHHQDPTTATVPLRRYDGLQKAYKELEKKYSEKELYAKKLEARIALGGFTEKCMKLEGKLRNANAKLLVYETDIKRLRQIENTLRHELDVKETVAQFRDDPELVDAARAEVQCREYQAALRDTEEKLAASEERCHVYVHNIETLNGDLEAMRMQAVDDKDQIEEVEADLEKSCREREALDAELRQAVQHIASLEASVKSHASRVEELQDALSDANGKLSALEAELDETKREALNNHNCWLSAEEARIRASDQLDIMVPKFDDMRTREARATEEAEAMAARLEKHQATAHRMETQRDHLVEEVDSLRHKLAATTNALTEADELHEALRKTKESLATVTRERDRMHDEVKGLSTMVADASNLKQEAIAQRDQLMEEYETLKSSLSDRIASLTSTSGKERETLDVLRQQLKESEAETRRLNMLLEHQKKLSAASTSAAMASRAGGSGGISVGGMKDAATRSPTVPATTTTTTATATYSTAKSSTTASATGSAATTPKPSATRATSAELAKARERAMQLQENARRARVFGRSDVTLSPVTPSPVRSSHSPGGTMQPTLFDIANMSDDTIQRKSL